MKIFDCFQFFDENMMLDLRMNILNKYVDYFVIVENLYMHNGKKKAQNFNIENFSKFKDKIKYVLIEKLPEDLQEVDEKKRGQDSENSKIINNALKIEKKQRNGIQEGLKESEENDLIFFGDVDEIPNFKNFKYKSKITVFKQKMLYYKFNLVYPNFVWMGTKVCKKKHLLSAEWLRSVKSKKYPWWRIDNLFSDKKYTNIGFVENGGWHFTNIKSPTDLDFKMRSFAHHLEYEESGMTLNELKNNMKNKVVFYDHNIDKSNSKKHQANIKLEKMSLKDLPSYISINNKKYSDWID